MVKARSMFRLAGAICSPCHMANLRLHRAQRLGPPRIHEFLKRFDFGHVSTLARSCNSRLLAAMDRSAWTSAAGIRVRWPL